MVASVVSTADCLCSRDTDVLGEGDLVEQLVHTLSSDFSDENSVLLSPLTVVSPTFVEGASKEGDFDKLILDGERFRVPQGVWIQRLSKDASRDSGSNGGRGFASEGDLSLIFPVGNGDLSLGRGDMSLGLGDMSLGLGDRSLEGEGVSLGEVSLDSHWFTRSVVLTDGVG